MSDEHVHTIPVDASLTPDEAWREICLMGVRATWTGSETWANITCDGSECASIAKGPDYVRQHNDEIIEMWIGGERVI